MAVEYVYHCEGPECEARGQTASIFPPYGWINVTERLGADSTQLHFHCWDCVMKYAAQVPPPEIVPIHGGPHGE